jgi:LuxR family maltose regulon positive regulatory protein
MKQTWSGSYVVQENKLLITHHNGQEIIELDTPAWLAWLESSSSFAFQSSEGSFTAHKTRASHGRGGWYWYAYRRQHGHLSNVYLGTSTKLTYQRLLATARTLAQASAQQWQATSALDSAPAALDKQAPATAPAQRAHRSSGRASAADALLATKLRIPRLSVQHIARPRLLALLDEGVRRPVTLVSAPAGSGKTTLLAAWAMATDLPLAWISLENSDNDPARLLAYLLAALASLDERIEASYRPTNPQTPAKALTAILNALTWWLEQDAVLIMDDYHTLTSEGAHDLLRFLVAHLPARLHLIIGTRVDPPLPLARLRARNQLYEIRAHALRFVTAEVEELAQNMGLALSQEAMQLLEQRTAGWIAGVQLLALALQGQTNATAFLQHFRGSHRFLLDYVSEEVLAQQEPEMQHFLLYTCILKRMNGSLCEAITLLPAGQKRLDELQGANLFVNALDETATWYSYHALFAETLLAHLQRQEPETLPILYQRASHWHEQHQELEEACEYAFLARDVQRAGDLLAILLPRMIEQGRFEQLGRWLEQLPADLIAASPQLYMVTLWMAPQGRRQRRDVEQLLKNMEQYVQQQPAADVSWVEPQGLLTMLQALTALAEHNLARAFALARQALRMLTTRDTAMSQLLARFLKLSLSVIYGASGDLASAEQILLDLSIVPVSAEYSLINLAAPFLTGELYRAQGQLHKGDALYTHLLQALKTPQHLQPLPLFVLSFSLLRKASILYEWNRLAEAANEIERVRNMLERSMHEIVPSSTQPALLAFILWAQARVAWAQGHPEVAHEFLERVRKHPEMLSTLPPGKEQPPVDVPVLAAQLALLCGQQAEASAWEQICSMRFDERPDSLLDGRQIYIALTLARVFIARGRQQHNETALAQALILLENWRGLAERLGFQGWLIEIQTLTALAFQAQGKIEQALQLLGDTLSVAEGEGYTRLFADEGQPMSALLACISDSTQASPTYIQRILAAMPRTHPVQLNAPTSEQHTQFNPLSTREREVLALLATGASNQQIADQLIISLNTAKRHVKNILARLDVTNRTQAVARARELHLL